jgi:hypothetical protein
MMHIVRGGHVDDVEIVGSDELLVVAIGSLQPHARGEFLGSVFAPRTDSDEILFGVRTHRLDEALGHPNRVQDAPSHRGCLGGRSNSGWG